MKTHIMMKQINIILYKIINFIINSNTKYDQIEVMDMTII